MPWQSVSHCRSEKRSLPSLEAAGSGCQKWKEGKAPLHQCARQRIHRARGRQLRECSPQPSSEPNLKVRDLDFPLRCSTQWFESAKILWAEPPGNTFVYRAQRIVQSLIVKLLYESIPFPNLVPFAKPG